MTDETAPEPFSPVDEDWDRALCVVAHPDDLEFGAAAAVARWTEQGKTVVYAMVTSGEAGIDAMSPDGVPGRSARPSRSSPARIVGVDVVEFLGQPDGVLEYGVALRQVICAAVRRHRPEIVITNNFRDTWGGQSLNQADHIAVGEATLDAVRDAGNRWVFARPDRRRAAAVGRREAGVGGRVPGRPARRRHDGHVRPRGAPRWMPTGPTSTGSAGSSSTRGSSWRAALDPPAPDSACRWRRRSRCSRWAGVSDPSVTCR